MRSARAEDGEGGSSYSTGSVFGSTSYEAANAMDFSSTTTAGTTTTRQRRRRRERGDQGGGNDSNRSRHSNHRDRMRTQAILEDLYS